MKKEFINDIEIISDKELSIYVIETILNYPENISPEILSKENVLATRESVKKYIEKCVAPIYSSENWEWIGSSYSSIINKNKKISIIFEKKTDALSIEKIILESKK